MKAGVCHNGPTDICVDGDSKVCHFDPSDFTLCSECTYFEPCAFYEKLRAELAAEKAAHEKTRHERDKYKDDMDAALGTIEILAHERDEARRIVCGSVQRADAEADRLFPVSGKSEP